MAATTVLLSHERSGSHLLGEIISSFARVRMYDEVCNGAAVRPADDPASFHRFRRDWLIGNPDKALSPGAVSQTAFVQDYFDHLSRLAGGEKVVIDLKYGHIHHFEGMWWPIFRRPFLFTFAERHDVSIIHLFRASAVEATISGHVARARKVWHSWEMPEGAATPFRLQPDMVVDDARLLGMQRTWIADHWMGKAKSLTMTYEDLTARLASGSDFADVAAFVGGEAQPELPPLRHEKVLASAGASVDNLDEVMAACRAAGLD